MRGRCLNEHEYAALADQSYAVGFDEQTLAAKRAAGDQLHYIDPKEYGSLMRFVNDSQEAPNLQLIYWPPLELAKGILPRRAFLVAQHDIPAHVELTFDYGKHYQRTWLVETADDLLPAADLPAADFAAADVTAADLPAADLPAADLPCGLSRHEFTPGHGFTPGHELMAPTTATCMQAHTTARSIPGHEFMAPSRALAYSAAPAAPAAAAMPAAAANARMQLKRPRSLAADHSAPSSSQLTPPPPGPGGGSRYEVGARVEARWGAAVHGASRKRFYPGVVEVANMDGSYGIRYNDGDFEAAVLPMYLRPSCRPLTSLEMQMADVVSTSASVAIALGGGSRSQPLEGRRDGRMGPGADVRHSKAERPMPSAAASMAADVPAVVAIGKEPERPPMNAKDSQLLVFTDVDGHGVYRVEKLLAARPKGKSSRDLPPSHYADCHADCMLIASLIRQILPRVPRPVARLLSGRRLVGARDVYPRPEPHRCV